MQTLPPSQVQSKVTDVNPTNAPSSIPSGDTVSAAPSLRQSTPQVIQPTASLTASPTTTQEVLPTASLTTSPTEPPPTTTAPSTEVCEFDLETTCIPPPGSTSCSAAPPPVAQCKGRPYEMIFLFNGGTCDQSFNVQGDEGLFFCRDLNGGVPTTRGESAYIVVTDTSGEIVYHSDFVDVGSHFALSDGGNDFESNQIITIYDRNDTSSPAFVLQSMQYHSSCSSNLFLKDRFGAVQLIQWVNEEQGVISCFANQTFDLDITIPVDIEGGPATLTSLTVASNIDPFFFNLTDAVLGTELDAGETLSTSINVTIDLTFQLTYNLLFTVTGETASGKVCRATDLASFTAGAALPPLFPTFAPTLASVPSGRPSGAPTDPVSVAPTAIPSDTPSAIPMLEPTEMQTLPPTEVQDDVTDVN